MKNLAVNTPNYMNAEEVLLIVGLVRTITSRKTLLFSSALCQCTPIGTLLCSQRAPNLFEMYNSLFQKGVIIYYGVRYLSYRV